MPPAKTANSMLRNMPSVDEMLRSEVACIVIETAGQRHAVDLIRRVLDGLREEISAAGAKAYSKQELTSMAESQVESSWATERLAGTHRVINATGVIIHTNLGRAPLSENARRAIADQAAGYCTLEVHGS